jgi:tetratricopeptide (TPR) repeat protein
MPEPGTIGVIAVLLVTVLLALIRYIHRREGKLRKYYHVRWKKSSSLRPTDVLRFRGKPERGFEEYYHSREEDGVIRERLERGQSVLVIGWPLAGKSRAVYQALVGAASPCDVIVPAVVDVDREDFLIPRRLAFWRRPVLLLDDLDKYVGREQFSELFHAFLDRDVAVVATCSRGEEYDRVRGRMERELGSVFGAPVELPRISLAEATEVAKQTSRVVPPRFDGNIGSIFLELGTMGGRFQRCDRDQKIVLTSLTRLYYAGIYTEREVFSVERLRRVCSELEGLEQSPHEWKALFDGLQQQGFIQTTREGIWAEEAYLRLLVGLGVSALENLTQMTQLFRGDPDALFSVGGRAFDVALVSVQKAEYAHIAKRAYEYLLGRLTIEGSPRLYAITQNNLGNVYLKLAEVEDKAGNCRRAIKAYEEALRVHTLDKFPVDYGMAQNNLGGAYDRLAEVQDKAKNCRRAIEAYHEALKVRTLQRSPMDYAMTQNNLGAAYQGLAEVEDKARNCKRAIEAYQEALKVRTLEHFPPQYASTQSNLGNAFRTLAEVEDKAGNCNRAIEACQEALKVHNLEHFPVDYAATQNNLGAAYGMLAEVEDKAGNCDRAIAACEEALKVRTLEHFPMDYAMTQNNLGVVYRTLAEVRDKAQNCKKAITAHEGALKVYTLEHFPMQYASTQSSLGNAHRTLAEVEDKARNCKGAIKACQEALRVYTLQQFPMDYALALNNLGAAHQRLAEVEDKAGNCKRAIAAYREALGVYTLEQLPMQYAMTQNNLGGVFGMLAEAEEKVGNCERAIRAFEEALKVFTREEFPQIYPLVRNNLRQLVQGVCAENKDR